MEQKMNKLLIRYSVFGLVLAIGGCANFGAVDPWMKTKDRFTLAGSNNLLNSEDFEMVDLAQAIDPMQLRKSESSGLKPRRVTKAEVGDNTDTEYNDTIAAKRMDELERAMYAFQLKEYDKYGVIVDRRNAVMDRMLGASEARCGAYKQYLRNFEITYETGLGIATTILGSAGAIATGVINARAFAGLAAMTSGAKAEIRQGVFSNVATTVLVPGIDQRRSQIMRELSKFRSLSITEYSLQAALHDAAKYHAACSLSTGLESAQDAMRMVDNPGLAQSNRTLKLLGEQAQLMTLYQLARKGELTADNAKVVKLEYEPSVITLAGSGAVDSSAAKEVSGDSLKKSATNIQALTESATASAVRLTAKIAKENDMNKKAQLVKQKNCALTYLSTTGMTCDKNVGVETPLTISIAGADYTEKLVASQMAIALRKACLNVEATKIEATKSETYISQLASVKTRIGAIEAFEKLTDSLVTNQALPILKKVATYFDDKPFEVKEKAAEMNADLIKIQSFIFPDIALAMGEIGKCWK
jgi:hypothetical protein